MQMTASISEAQERKKMSWGTQYESVNASFAESPVAGGGDVADQGEKIKFVCLAYETVRLLSTFKYCSTKMCLH